MQDGVRNVFTYYIQKFLHSYYNVLLGQSNVQRVWFGSAVPISYTVIPGKSFSVHVLACLPEAKHQHPISVVVAHFHSSPGGLGVVSRKRYTQWTF